MGSGRQRARLFLILVVAGIMIAVLASPVQGIGTQCSGPGPAAIAAAGNVSNFILALESDNFIVQEGKLEVFPVIDMYDAGIVASCFGNNPLAPYMVYKLPPAPGQTISNHITDAQINPSNRGLWVDYYLRTDEALVFIGPTPPAVDYFSYRSYIIGRWFPQDLQFRRVFASLGDTVNLRTIWTSGTPNGAAGDPFERATVIITTADSDINTRVRTALSAGGYSSSIMNTDVIPSSLVRMGLVGGDDTFGFIHRVAFFHNQTAGIQYMNCTPGRVFRVTPNGSAPPPNLYPVPSLRVRGTGDPFELNLLPDLIKLRDAIIARYGAGNSHQLVTGIWLLEGYDAIQRGIDVIGENRDTVYLSSQNFTLPNDPAEFAIVYGVNHAATGKVIYSSFGIYGANALNGVGAVANYDYNGTADEFLPGNPNAKYLYVWKVARQCGGDPRCLKVPYNIGGHGINLDKQAFIGVRAYVERSTNTGPSWSEILYDQVIKFSKTPVPPSPPPPYDGGDGGGGGDGSDTAPPSPAGQTLPGEPVPPAEQPTGTATVNVGGNSAIGKVTVIGKGVADVVVTANPLLNAPPGVPLLEEPVYQYLKVTPAHFTTIGSAIIEFDVAKSWIEKQQVSQEDIVLNRFSDGKWTKLPTFFIREQNGFMYYRAESPGLSYFAIALQKGGTNMASVTPAMTTVAPAGTFVTGSPTSSPIMTKTTQTVPPAPVTAPAGGVPLMLIIAGVIGAIAIITGAFFVRRWWIRRQNPALFRKHD